MKKIGKLSKETCLSLLVSEAFLKFTSKELKKTDLVLKHEYDGRDLDLEHAEKVVDHVKDLWKDDVRLYTILEDEVWEI